MLGHPCLHICAPVTTIRPNAAIFLQLPVNALKTGFAPSPLLSRLRRHDNGHNQSKRVHKDMVFAPLNLLVRA